MFRGKELGPAAFRVRVFLAQSNSVRVVNLSLRLTELKTTAKSVPGTSDLEDLRWARTARVLFDFIMPLLKVCLLSLSVSVSRFVGVSAFRSSGLWVLIPTQTLVWTNLIGPSTSKTS